MKIQLIDIDKKKDAQILQDIAMTPSERFVRMFDLIEFGLAFSQFRKIPEDREGWTTFTLKKRTPKDE